MQDAVPIRLGQEFAAYGLAIEKGKKFLQLASDSLRELGLGGSAVGTGINTHPDYRVKAIANLARISGQQLVPAADMRWAMQSNACMAEVSAALRCIALEVIRIERYPYAVVRTQHRLRGNLSAQPATRLIHHARQDQPRHAGAGRHGQLSGHRQ
jgi:hypothetical protein